MATDWFLTRIRRVAEPRKNRQQCMDCACFVDMGLHTIAACQRYKRIIQLRETMTLVQIGRTLGISRERVRQILEKRNPYVRSSHLFASSREILDQPVSEFRR